MHWKNPFVHFNDPERTPVTLDYMDIVLRPACLTVNFYLQLTSAYDRFKPSEKGREVRSQEKHSSWNKAVLNVLIGSKGRGGQQKLQKAGCSDFIQPRRFLVGMTWQAELKHRTFQVGQATKRRAWPVLPKLSKHGLPVATGTPDHKIQTREGLH